MKCSAVRKDFWCLTNKVNQIRNVCCCSLTPSLLSPVSISTLVITPWTAGGGQLNTRLLKGKGHFEAFSTATATGPSCQSHVRWVDIYLDIGCPLQSSPNGMKYLHGGGDPLQSGVEMFVTVERQNPNIKFWIILVLRSSMWPTIKT